MNFETEQPIRERGTRRRLNGHLHLANILMVAFVGVIGEAAVQTATGDIFRVYENPTLLAGDGFGGQFAAFGDDLLASAPGNDTGADNAGVVYLLDGDTGDVLRTFFNPNPIAGDVFGVGVAAFGAGEIVVGAPTGNFNRPGVAYLIDASSGDVLHTFTNPTNPTDVDWFGAHVATSGNNIIVSAPFDGAPENIGAVFLFDGTTGEHVRTLLDPTPDNGGVFGNTLLVDNGHLLITAPGDNMAGTDAGAAFMFDPNNGDLLKTYLSPEPDSGDEFGVSLSVVDNLVAIGAPKVDVSGMEDAGAVYLFNRDTEQHVSTIFNPEPGFRDNFGTDLARVGDYLLVGALRDTRLFREEGSAYLFEVSSGNLLQTFENPTPTIRDFFGHIVGELGDSALIGSVDDDFGASNAGAIYRFEIVPEPKSISLLVVGTLMLLLYGAVNRKSSPRIT